AARVGHEGREPGVGPAAGRGEQRPRHAPPAATRRRRRPRPVPLNCRRRGSADKERRSECDRWLADSDSSVLYGSGMRGCAGPAVPAVPQVDWKRGNRLAAASMMLAHLVGAGFTFAYLSYMTPKHNSSTVVDVLLFVAFVTIAFPITGALCDRSARRAL